MRPITGPHRLDQRAQARRAVERQRPLARAQVERLDHAQQPEPVVEVVVGEEHRVDLGQPDRAQQLLLGPLAAVEQQPVAARAQQQRGQPAPCRRDRAGRAGEEEREIHRTRTLERGRARNPALAELHELELEPPVERGREPHRVRRSAPALGRRARVEDVEPGARARATAGASGRTRPRRPRRSAGAGARAAPSAGPPSCVIDDPRALRLDDPHRGQPHPHLGLVDVAVHRVHRRAERLAAARAPRAR